MALFDDPTEPHVIEHLRRSITMLSPGQAASIDRDRALALLEELQRLRHEQRGVAAQLREIAERMGAGRARAAAPSRRGAAPERAAGAPGHPGPR